MTRERMYLETMERVLGPMDKTIVDQNSASPPVPYIALEPSAVQNRGGAANEEVPEWRRRSPPSRSLRSFSRRWPLFVVDPTEQALILRFGQPVRDLIGAPGLYFKWPFIDTVVYIDKRILALDR